jgi:hypothetical protein
MLLVEACPKIIKYQFKTPHILWEALRVGKSNFTTTGDREIPLGNRRQAVVEDIILSHVLCSRWYREGKTRGNPLFLNLLVLQPYADWCSADWQILFEAVASNTNLAKIGTDHGLAGCLNIASSEQPLGKNNMATTVEAIIAVAYENANSQATVAVMKSLGLLKAEDYAPLVMSCLFAFLSPLCFDGRLSQLKYGPSHDMGFRLNHLRSRSDCLSSGDTRSTSHGC